ncbi:MAG: hypothetical protein ACK4TA_07895 [Saprospiraceae bacterium]
MVVKLQCPNCQSTIRYEDMNIDKLIAKCHHCYTVFGFEEQVRQTMRQRSEVPLPPGIEAASYLSELDIQINWRKTTNAGFFVFFTIFWNAVLIPFVLIALTQGEWIILLFISLHLMVGLSLLYYTLCIFFNTTYITVNRQEISVLHKPLKMPFYPDRQVTVDRVEQLFIDKYVESRTNGRPNYAFGVYAHLKNGNHIKLIRGLKNHDQARYIEQEVERFLNLEDKAVEGEWLGD